MSSRGAPPSQRAQGTGKPRPAPLPPFPLPCIASPAAVRLPPFPRNLPHQSSHLLPTSACQPFPRRRSFPPPLFSLPRRSLHLLPTSACQPFPRRCPYSRPLFVPPPPIAAPPANVCLQLCQQRVPALLPGHGHALRLAHQQPQLRQQAWVRRLQLLQQDLTSAWAYKDAGVESLGET